jgi:hypothetical protein
MQDTVSYKFGSSLVDIDENDPELLESIKKHEEERKNK